MITKLFEKIAVGEGWGILSGGRIQFAVDHEIELCPGGGTWQQCHSFNLVCSWGRPGRCASSPSNRGGRSSPSCCTMVQG